MNISMMTQREFYQLLLFTYTKVRKSEELALHDIIDEMIHHIESTCDDPSWLSGKIEQRNYT
ncbi:hypothetical protein J6TS1_32590 [Siminovitchia terrae]|uniref:Phage protein n=1 Tax=Siminovitchia terrae TaxID=1914933 RepID=A0ABQ4L0E2_SIMTE|nr:hypothetical protein J6TS1_32590 [Siminovitchia terrae]